MEVMKVLRLLKKQETDSADSKRRMILSVTQGILGDRGHKTLWSDCLYLLDMLEFSQMTAQQLATLARVEKSRLDQAGLRNSEAAPTLKPPLKWAGGKRWQLPHLRPLWQPYTTRRLVEPFCGGLAVTLGLQPRRALLNDVNTHVIHFYQWLNRGLVTSLPMRNDERVYYAYRDRFNRLLANDAGESAEAAALFYYLNRTGYNGLCRFNQKGEFNVPFGRYKQIRYSADFTD